MKTIPFRLLVCFAGCLFLSCRGNAGDHTGANSDNSSLEYQKSAQQAEPNQLPAWNRPRSKERQQERNQMASEIRRYYSLNAPKILEAMQNVPRHWFVPAEQQVNAYVDSPLPIGHDQTISQPFIVAYMTSVLAPDPNSRVLEIGTGSGYQAAVLNEFTPHVFSIEIVKPLGERAIEVFKKYEYNTIRVKIGDGYKGWPEYAPFDAIIVTCAPDKIPGPLLDQLKPGGKMIIPVGKQRDGQQLILVTKDLKGKISKRSMMPVRFVPLTREKE